MERINHRESRERKKSESENKSVSKEQKNKMIVIEILCLFVVLIYLNLNFLGFHFAGFQFSTLAWKAIPVFIFYFMQSFQSLETYLMFGFQKENNVKLNILSKIP